MADIAAGSIATDAIVDPSRPVEKPKLDPTLYKPGPEAIAFFRQQTGITSDEELKEHVISIQKEAWDIMNYLCIQNFGFTRLKLKYLRAYPDLLKMGKERKDAIFLDFGCCFGCDARYAVSDGYPLENVICSDIEKPFWELGHRLFGTTPESYPMAFVPGDVFDPAHIAPHEPFYEPPTTPRPDLSALTSLTPLQGHVAAIHASAFFHLFYEDEQIAAARALASLLSPVPGSMLFGVHVSKGVSGPRDVPNNQGKVVYCYSPEDWKALWDGQIFKKGTVEVTAVLRDMVLDDGRGPTPIMGWSVKRI